VSESAVGGKVETAYSVPFTWLPVWSTDVLQPLSETAFIFQWIANDNIVDIYCIKCLTVQYFLLTLFFMFKFFKVGLSND